MTAFETAVRLPDDHRIIISTGSSSRSSSNTQLAAKGYTSLQVSVGKDRTQLKYNGDFDLRKTKKTFGSVLTSKWKI